MTLDDDIVLTGISGRYPDCDNFEELKNALLEGVDLMTIDDRRYPPGTYNTPPRTGKIRNVERFDAGFFGVSPKQADLMDPRHRMMFETAFEAIVDSGFNPVELRGTKTGVYVGISAIDNMNAYKQLEKTQGYTMIGMSLGQIANRTSYIFDFKGPSFSMDTACSSAMVAFVNAVEAMEKGEIESAIVSGVHLNFHPHEAEEFTKLNMLALDGKCKVFNKFRDGYVRSEHIVTVLLQKKNVARRIYSTVLGAKMNCDGYKTEGITYPSSEQQFVLMQKLFKEKNLDPNDISYVEMHGTGTPAGDIEECKSIFQMFCQNRKEPLPVGAVKSNIGHGETASAMGSISKVLVAMETGIIPANIHCDELDDTLPGISDGKMHVVRKNQKWFGGKTALNSFGFGGANAHLILESHKKIKIKHPKTLQRLVHASGRTEESVRYYLKKLEENGEDHELLALVDEIHKKNIEGHTYRGYKILGENSIEEVSSVSNDRRPIYFVYTGMGCQWPAMCKDLFKIQVFKTAFTRCSNALKPYGVDLERIVTSDDPTIFDDISNCFSAISSTEIALTEVLKSFGIYPDGILGHSLGEVGCAFADGGLEIEQAALLGFARGYATSKAKHTLGLMAAIGLSPEETQKYLPEDVGIACRNSSSSSTISGPKESVEKVVNLLKSKGVFAKEVNTGGGYAFHTKYQQEAGEILLEFAKNVIKKPTVRSSKWISTSWPENEWDKNVAKYNSAEYHFHNFLNPVLFDQAFKHIPDNAIVIEVAPHGLLQSILKKELSKSVTILSLVNRQSSDNFRHVLSAIGKVYINGGNVDLRKFYNEVDFPVGRGTKNIGSFIKWDHSVKWFVPYFNPHESFGKKTVINVGDNNQNYLEGHNIDGRVLVPATGYLELVWKILARTNAKTIEELPVVFENVKISRATVLPKNQDVTFLVNIMFTSGIFEVSEGGSVVCSGKVTVPRDVTNQFTNVELSKPKRNGTLMMKQTDIYKLYHLKRYLYEGKFRGIEELNVNGTYGILKWHGEFTAFMDTMLQITLLSDDSNELMLPTFIEKIIIDPRNHLRHFCEENLSIPVIYDKYLNVIKSGNIEIVGLESSRAPKRHNISGEPNLESCNFVPYENLLKSEINFEISVLHAVQIILENNRGSKVLKILETVPEKEEQFLKLIKSCVKKEPQISLQVLKKDESLEADLVILMEKNLRQVDIKEILGKLRTDGFVIYQGNKEAVSHLNYTTVFESSYNKKGIFLLRLPKEIHKTHAVVKVSNENFTWLEHLKKLLKSSEKEIIYLYSQNEETSGIMGLVKCLVLEPYPKTTFSCFLIQDKDVETFSTASNFYKNQIDKNLTFNVYNKGSWGSYRYSPLNQMQNINVEHACSLIQTIGDLSSFKWVERPKEYYKFSPSSEVAYVFYSALNFKDVMVVTGKISNNSLKDVSSPNLSVGLEFSGTTKNGRKIMGITSGSSMGLQVATDPLFTWEIPRSWSLEDAATVPCVYATCYYAMVIRGKIQRGESILIHAGTGGVGLAAISIALGMECEVYTTCGSQEKKEFLRRMFPKIKEENIGNSRDRTFENMIKRNTRGRGVDLVLNSLAGDLFQASLRCIGERGRFLEIGKVDFFAGTPINSKMFLKNCSFHGVLLDNLFEVNCQDKMDIKSLLEDGILKGVVRPLPRTIFEENEVENAFRFLSTGKHKGKVLIKIRKEDATTLKQPVRTISALPKMYFESNKSYVIIGGLGGFGLELTKFLINRNAKKIVLNSKRGVTNGYQSYCLKKFSNMDDITIKVSTDDTSTIEGSESLLKIASNLAPIGGIFHSALHLADALTENQTQSNFLLALKAKAVSLSNLDKISRKNCLKLDHFVALSSIACGRGNAGQSNYGMANSIMERICEKRRDDGLPALAIQWGIIGDVGAVAEKLEVDRNLNVSGLLPQNINSCLESLEKFMLQPNAIVASHMLQDSDLVSSSSSCKTLSETIAHVLGIKNIEHVDKRQTLTQLGLDSLMVSEIKQTLYRNYNIELEIDDIRELTFERIEQMGSTEDKKEETKEKYQNGEATYSLKTVNAVLPKDMIIEIKNGNNSNKILFLLPPIEAKSDIMLDLADYIEGNIYCLQYTKQIDFDDIRDFGEYFVKQIRNIQKSGPYILCGYSYGSVMVFEIALQLENSGESVEIILLDGSPHFVKYILQDGFCRNSSNIEKSKIGMLEHFVKLFDDIDHEKALKLLDTSLSWEKQIEVVSNFLCEQTKYNYEEISVSIDRFCKRVIAGFYYKPTRIFKGKATLIRSVINYLDFPEDYNLNSICEKPVTVHKLDGNHQEILLGDSVLKMAKIINQHLKQ